MSGFVGAGWERYGVTVAVTKWPEFFKKPILVIQRGNNATKVASFNSERDAEFFIEAFREMFDGLIGG